MTQAVKRAPKSSAVSIESDWLTSIEAAAYLKIKVETLYKWAKTGSRGPRSYGDAKCRRYKKSECDAWLEAEPRETADSLKSSEDR